MPVIQIMLSLVWDFPILTIIAIYLVVCYIVTHRFQRSNLELIYKPESPMAKLVESSSLAKFVYVPYSLVWHVTL